MKAKGLLEYHVKQNGRHIDIYFNKYLTPHTKNKLLKAGFVYSKSLRCWTSDRNYELGIEIAEKAVEESKKSKINGVGTLCWRCQKATGGCSWSKKLEPVPGWMVKMVRRKDSNVDDDTGYFVIACPEYVEDRKCQTHI